MKEQKFTLRLPTELYNKAKEFKKNTRIPLNTLIVHSLTKYLKENMDADLYEYYDVKKNEKI